MVTNASLFFFRLKYYQLFYLLLVFKAKLCNQIMQNDFHRFVMKTFLFLLDDK